MAEVRSLEPLPRKRFYSLAVCWGQLREKTLLFQSRWIYQGVAAALVCGIGFYVYQNQRTLGPGGEDSTVEFSVAAFQPVALKLDTKKMIPKGITHAVIELPKGVSFYSASFPQIQEQDQLKLALPQSRSNSTLPIVIQASAAGTKWVKVKFVDDQDRTIEEKILQIQFKSGSEIKSDSNQGLFYVGT